MNLCQIVSCLMLNGQQRNRDMIFFQGFICGILITLMLVAAANNGGGL